MRPQKSALRFGSYCLARSGNALGNSATLSIGGTTLSPARASGRARAHRTPGDRTRRDRRRSVGETAQQPTGRERELSRQITGFLQNEICSLLYAESRTWHQAPYCDRGSTAGPTYLKIPVRLCQRKQNWGQRKSGSAFASSGHVVEAEADPNICRAPDFPIMEGRI
jgi:hypothetical protein